MNKLLKTDPSVGLGFFAATGPVCFIFFGGSGPSTAIAGISETSEAVASLVGDADEQEFADQFAPLLQRLDLNIPVSLVPDMKHADMISAPAALQAVVRAVAAKE